MEEVNQWVEERKQLVEERKVVYARKRKEGV